MIHLKVYFAPNLDGLHSFMVAARNQKEACKLFGVSTYYFRQMDGHTTYNQDYLDVAMSDPVRVWKRKITHVMKQYQWVGE